MPRKNKLSLQLKTASGEEIAEQGELFVEATFIVE